MADFSKPFFLLCAILTIINSFIACKLVFLTANRFYHYSEINHVCFFIWWNTTQLYIDSSVRR